VYILNQDVLSHLIKQLFRHFHEYHSHAQTVISTSDCYELIPLFGIYRIQSPKWEYESTSNLDTRNTNFLINCKKKNKKKFETNLNEMVPNPQHQEIKPVGRRQLRDTLQRYSNKSSTNSASDGPLSRPNSRFSSSVSVEELNLLTRKINLQTARTRFVRNVWRLKPATNGKV
jgi:hypothetical protein